MIGGSPSLRQLLSELKTGRGFGILTGPGLSSECGLPPLTTEGPIWEGFDAAEVASPAAFAADPARVWRFYAWRREAVAAARPGAAHLAIARIQRLLPATALSTLSVDGLHRAAGSAAVAEVHGAIDRARCPADGAVVPLPLTTRIGEELPRCPRCRGILRPDVVWPGEPVRREAWKVAVRSVEECAVFVIAGFPAGVRPVDALLLAGSRAGAKLIEVNAEPVPETPLVDLSLQQAPSVFFPGLARELLEMLPA